jgi:hypothetical protein
VNGVLVVVPSIVLLDRVLMVVFRVDVDVIDRVAAADVVGIGGGGGRCGGGLEGGGGSGV